MLLGFLPTARLTRPTCHEAFKFGRIESRFLVSRQPGKLITDVAFFAVKESVGGSRAAVDMTCDNRLGFSARRTKRAFFWKGQNRFSTPARPIYGDMLPGHSQTTNMCELNP